jgi:mono/diheme cytochrome c family protein
MSLKNAGMALGVAFGFMAFVACSGSEAGSQGGASESMADTQAAMDQGGQQMADQGGQQMQLPEGVTMEMVNQGKALFSGAGLCHVCHGEDAKGMPGLGANLTDDEWLHSDGSYDGIVQTVMNGVDSSVSTSGTAMPPKGGSGITDEQVREVAAYVWTLSH